MAEYSGFFDAQEVTQPDGSKVFDREYFAKEFAEYFKLFIGNGIFVSPTNQLKVIAGTGMNVKLLPGWAFVNGYWYHNDAKKTITIPSNVSPSDVNYSIHLTLSETADRKIIQEQGVATTLSSVQIRLANIKIKPGATAIYDSDITDTRPDENQCGFVKGLVDVVDTNDLFTQFTNMFNAWFDAMKGQLSTDAAGNLQTQMSAVKSAIGSDYIVGYTTSPSYSGGIVTLYAGTKFITANGKDANGNIKQDIIALSINKTLSLTGNINCNIFLGVDSSMFSIENSNQGIVDFVSQLPTTVATTNPYMYYVINEHKYYRTSGSTTANWQTWNCCKVASVRVTSSTITYFKPNLQLNLAQKIGKDKLLMTMPDIQSNTDKEFVPSASAIKEIVDWPIFQGLINGWVCTKMASGECKLTYLIVTGFNVGTPWLGGYYHISPYFNLPFSVFYPKLVGCFQNAAVLAKHCGTDFFYGDPVRPNKEATAMRFYIHNDSAAVMYSENSGVWVIELEGRWKL